MKRLLKLRQRNIRVYKYKLTQARIILVISIETKLLQNESRISTLQINQPKKISLKKKEVSTGHT